MRLEKIILAVCAGLLGSAAMADDAHHPGQPAAAPAAKPGGTMDMQGMQANMKRMQEQMAQIQRASDPKERDRLVAEHMKTMQQSMPMMRMMDCPAAEQPAAK
jgi:hypothetical protein